jgi:DNA polymerase III subunit epsilon
LDTETTGLSSAMGHRIVEVAAVRVLGWQTTATFNSLVNPGRPMDPGASRVNGIYDHDVATAPSFADIAGELHSMLDGAVLVAHNARFDAAFLGMEYENLKTTSPEEIRQYLIPNPWLCTLQIARRLFYFDRNSLGHVARNLGIRIGRAHRALSDVHTTIAILKQMSKQLGKLRLTSVADLLHAQGGPIFVPQQHQPILPIAIAEAISQRCSIFVRYQGRGDYTDRTISPLYATEQNGATYIVAYCHLRQAQRTFRLDRIIRATIIDDQA